MSSHTMDISEDTVQQAAADIGLRLSETDRRHLVEEITSEYDRYVTFETETQQAPAQPERRRSDDPYNAFLYRFEQAGGDGPLSSLDVAVKDLMAVNGIPMTCGSQAVEYTPEYDATVVRRLRQDGATLVGTTNMDEFALTTTGETCAHGRTLNPIVEGHVPGGSSSGSGAAVAADLVDAALGSDTGGSIRIPASFCGVVGLKPTHRSVSRFGVADLAPSLDHVGPLASSVETAFRVFDSIAGPDVRDLSTHGTRPPSNTASQVGRVADETTVGVVEEAMNGSDGSVTGAVESTFEDLSDEGLTIERVSFPAWGDLPAAVVVIASTEFAALVQNNGLVRGTGTGYPESWREALANIDGDDLGDGVVDSVLIFSTLFDSTNGRLYTGVQSARERFTQTVCEAFDEVDVLALPTTQSTAPEFDQVTDTDDLLRTIANTGPFDLTGHPAISIPCESGAGKPVGFQLVAPWYGEEALAQIGGVVESVGQS